MPEKNNTIRSLEKEASRSFTLPGRLLRFKRENLDLLLLAVSLLVVGIVAWIILARVEDNIHLNLEETLGTMLATTREAMQEWEVDCKMHAEIWAASSDLREDVAMLFRVPHQRDSLLACPAQKRLRDFYRTYIEKHGFQGFFIISPDMISLASTRDANTGARNLLEHRGEFISAILKGSTALSLPLESDVPLPGRDGNLQDREPTMFVGAPVVDSTGTVIAILTLRMSPDHDFTTVTRLGSLGRTGETFAFNRQGQLITASRFEETLIEAGILVPGRTSVLSVCLRVPEDNLADSGATPGDLSSRPFSEMARQAMAGESGIDLGGYPSYLGREVVGVWCWDERLGFGMATEMSRAEAYSSYRILRIVILGGLGFTVLLFISLLLRLTTSRARALGLVEEVSAARDQLENEMDIRRNVEKILRENEAYIRAVVDSVADGIITVDTHGEIETVNTTAERIFGLEEKEFLGRNAGELLEKEDRGRLSRVLRKISRNSGKSADLRSLSLQATALTSAAETFPVELSISEMRDGDTLKLVIIIRDITRQKKLENRLRQLSTRDGLTRLANRRSFDQELEKEWSRAMRNSLPISLVMLDIDFFKNYNDSLGHQAGDDTLKKVAAVMREILKRPGDLAARYGGEEYTGLLPETGEKGARSIAEQIRRKVMELAIPHPASEIEEVVTVSIGVSTVVPKRGSRAATLVGEADRALYEAKRGGRNRVAVSDGNRRSDEEGA